MKFGKTKLHIGHLISVFMAFVIGISLSYVGISTYTHLIEARGLDILSFLSVEKLTPAITCPQLKEIPTASGTRILKDECSGTYWHSMDLPILDKNDQFVGYTWQQAKDSCENLAKVNLSDGTNSFSVFRLPTVDELLTLVDMPCTGTGGCSPLTRLTATIPAVSGPVVPVTKNSSQSYFYKKSNKALGNGSYWASNSLDANTAGSVNLLTGTVNNPSLGKSIKLNVRCIYNLPGTINSGNLIDPGEQVSWVDRSTAATDATPDKYKISYRSNIQVATCLAPFDNNGKTGIHSDQCTGKSSTLTVNNIMFSCNGTFKPYLHQVCKNNAGTGSGTECVDNAGCVTAGEKCVFDTAVPFACKDPNVCFTGFTYYTPSTCSNEPSRDCQIANGNADCLNGGTCVVEPEGQCIDEKAHVCKLPSLALNGASLDLATNHLAYNTASEYAQRWLTASTQPTIAQATHTGTTTPAWFPPEDWFTDYNATASDPEAQDCRFKAAPGYFWNGTAGINSRDYSCPDKVANSDWNMQVCSNDPTKACTVANVLTDCAQTPKNCSISKATCAAPEDCGATGGTCGVTCDGQPGQYHQDYNGSAWLPPDTGAEYSEAPFTNACVFKSTNSALWAWDGAGMTAVDRTIICTPAKPGTATWFNGGSFPQTWIYKNPVPTDGTTTGAYSPVQTATAYSTTDTTNLCDYTCPNNTVTIAQNCTSPALSSYQVYTDGDGNGNATTWNQTLVPGTCGYTPTSYTCTWGCDGNHTKINGICSPNSYTLTDPPKHNGYRIIAEAQATASAVNGLTITSTDVQNGANKYCEAEMVNGAFYLGRIDSTEVVKNGDSDCSSKNSPRISFYDSGWYDNDAFRCNSDKVILSLTCYIP